MPFQFDFRLEDTSYPFYVEDSFNNVASIIRQHVYPHLVILNDASLSSSIINSIQEILISTNSKIDTLAFECSESSKRLSIIEKILDQLMQLGATRNTTLIAVGGGLAGNMVGLAAALLFRGIKLIHIPTTFLAASDSTPSLKQAVNLKSGKNLVGLFYKPEFVYVNVSLFHQLPKRHITTSLCELSKNLLVIKPDKISYFQKIFNMKHNYTNEQYKEMMRFCLDAKASVLIEDKYERKEGLILEYGHTIGHAVELAGQGSLFHGECVGFGMLCAASISHKLGYLSRAEMDLHWELLHSAGLDINVDTLDYDRIKSYLLNDNKKGYIKPIPGKTAMILLEKIGCVLRSNKSMLHMVDNNLICDTVLEYIAFFKRKKAERTDKLLPASPTKSVYSAVL